jgi:predicted CXXCH cytochrome family protein
MPAGYRVYSLEATLARSSFDEGLADAVRPGRDEVMCLSCHFAHAGPFNSGLRWDYNAVITGEKGKGACFLCHTEKADIDE